MRLITRLCQYVASYHVLKVRPMVSTKRHRLDFLTGHFITIVLVGGFRTLIG